MGELIESGTDPVLRYLRIETHSGTHTSRRQRLSRRFGQVHNTIDPIPPVPLITPERREQPALVAIVSTANGAAEQHEPTMTLAGAEHVARVPRKRCSVTPTSTSPCSAHATSSVESSSPCHEPSCQFAM